MGARGSAMPGSFRSAVADRPHLLFFPLALALSWYPWILGMLGVEGTDGINPLGVLVAAHVTAGIAGGWPEARGVFARIGRWRAPLALYAMALFLPVALAAAAGLIALAVGTPTTSAFMPSVELVDRFLIAFLFVGAGRGARLARIRPARAGREVGLDQGRARHRRGLDAVACALVGQRVRMAPCSDLGSECGRRCARARLALSRLWGERAALHADAREREHGRPRLGVQVVCARVPDGAVGGPGPGRGWR